MSTVHGLVVVNNCTYTKSPKFLLLKVISDVIKPKATSRSKETKYET
jgi:hypothetical protein